MDGGFMLKPRSVALGFLLGMMVLGAGLASGQTYPSKLIRIVTSEVGGSNDIIARNIAQGLQTRLGQRVIIDNRGGSVIIAAEQVAKAPPDGHTLLVFGSVFWLLPYLQDKVPYDPVKDFLPITMAVRSPNMVVVDPKLPVKSIKELIALAKAKPGALNYGTGGSGSSSHLAAELFRSMAGIDIVRVAFKGSGPAMTAVMAGEVQILMSSAGGLAEQARSGRLKALALTGAQRSPAFPDMPTVAEGGLPGYEFVQMTGIFAPAKTPTAIVNRLNQEIVRVLNQPDVKERLTKTGVEVIGSSPEELESKVKAEMARLGKVIRDVGIRAE
jgi:tripartite-type tricarboxylate transporter receptor subunit TctC